MMIFKTECNSCILRLIIKPFYVGCAIWTSRFYRTSDVKRDRRSNLWRQLRLRPLTPSAGYLIAPTKAKRKWNQHSPGDLYLVQRRFLCRLDNIVSIHATFDTMCLCPERRRIEDRLSWSPINMLLCTYQITHQELQKTID